MSSDADYDARVEATYAAIEEALDVVDSDLDYQTGGGVLTVKFENGTSMIFSRQPPVHQLWLATRSGGFHFDYDEDAEDWRNSRDGSLLRPFVVAEMQSQAGVEFEWQ